MIRTLLSLIFLAAATAPAAAAPFENFYNYEEPRPPVAGDCDAIRAAVGPSGTWRGAYSGRHYDNFNDQYYPFALAGCFESELACRIWQQQAITYADRGPTTATSCRLEQG